ncbi:hypothetical protein KY495_20690 [Massilia sp. PAMC28688]|uniref:hypothetical protein n=1 Tax=Massilia sp. PAMC28688 TaxID=2861283 RepID=UPI001C630D58|nr:hypothetical protein [Massilia sp. PAMC28688]QYF93083.1 hypothetical protein KY495_20690 [Massilia sp. PAMC28688]
MHWNSFRTLLFFATAPSVALAQIPSPAQDSRAGPFAASGSAYQSAFADYKPYKEPVVMSWREANDQVRDSGGMQGHDMATMKSQSEDPHAGHDMSKMGATPAAAARPGAGSSADEAGASHAAHGAKKAQAEDPHAGHDMSKITPAKPAAPTPVRARPPSPAKKPGANPGAIKAQPADPHAGHDMSKMSAPPRQDVPGATDKASHGAHSAPPANRPKNKREKE